MTGGFHDRQRLSPTGLVLVVSMHAAALTALALVKAPEYFHPDSRTRIFDVPLPVDPDPTPPEPERQVEPRRAEHRSVLDRFDTVARPSEDRGVAEIPIPPLPPGGEVGEQQLPERRVEPIPPVRVEAQFDPRYADDLQPPYPPSEQRLERDGIVRVRLTIGSDGRVKAIERLSATSDAFWRSTQRHALARWRFRPATLDGSPVESSKVMNVYFRIES